jgi:hypothetical protein
MSGMLDQALERHGLAVVGSFHPSADDRLPAEIGTLVLVGARDRAMWKAFRASPESGDGQPHPMDRWSRRVLDAVAAGLGARAFYPFGGPPWMPFQRWAERGEGACPSPVGMQVSAARGLWVSYRGALGFPGRISVADPVRASPCHGCAAPCLTACPVDAFAAGRYDVARCAAHITSPAGTECRSTGCLVRHACPAGRGKAPPAEQCAFHMEAFIRARLAEGAGGAG